MTERDCSINKTSIQTWKRKEAISPLESWEWTQLLEAPCQISDLHKCQIEKPLSVGNLLHQQKETKWLLQSKIEVFFWCFMESPWNNIAEFSYLGECVAGCFSEILHHSESLGNINSSVGWGLMQRQGGWITEVIQPYWIRIQAYSVFWLRLSW